MKPYAHMHVLCRAKSAPAAPVEPDLLKILR